MNSCRKTESNWLIKLLYIHEIDCSTIPDQFMYIHIRFYMNAKMLTIVTNGQFRGAKRDIATFLQPQEYKKLNVQNTLATTC